MGSHVCGGKSKGMISMAGTNKRGGVESQRRGDICGAGDGE